MDVVREGVVGVTMVTGRMWKTWGSGKVYDQLGRPLTESVSRYQPAYF